MRHASGVRVQKVQRVLRFDGPLGPEGYGGALRAQFMAAFGGKNHTTGLRPW